eukprot:127453_1
MMMNTFDVESWHMKMYEDCESTTSPMISTSPSEDCEFEESSHKTNGGNKGDVEAGGDDYDLEVFTAVPLIPKINTHLSGEESSMAPEGNYHPCATYTIIAINICAFFTLVSLYGFDSTASNPFLGPPIQVTDHFGSKNPLKIKEDHEYWRVVTAIFQNVGLLDLFFSACMVYQFGVNLESRWGWKKMLTVYLLSGIGGNIHSSFADEPSAISVGNGGSILGLLGAIHVDLLTTILLQKDQISCISPFEKSFVNITYIVVGISIGLFTTFIAEWFVSDDGTGVVRDSRLTYHKDWSVLYGGMLSGMIVTCIWNLYTIKKDEDEFGEVAQDEKMGRAMRHMSKTKLCACLILIMVPPLMEAMYSVV